MIAPCTASNDNENYVFCHELMLSYELYNSLMNIHETLHYMHLHITCIYMYI